jgi:hypothetical protein
MSTTKHNRGRQTVNGVICRASFRLDLRSRRIVQLELPEFLIYALEQRVAEANVGATDEEFSTLNDYIETELVNLVTVRDVAELEITAPGFGAAVQNWLDQVNS